ncbi:hypothetical protein CR513_02970, partial [Mucuna pruriens]
MNYPKELKSKRQGAQQLMVVRGEDMVWNNIKNHFIKKYFHNSVRNYKDSEFLRLYQEVSTIHEYTTWFKYLSPNQHKKNGGEKSLRKNWGMKKKKGFECMECNTNMGNRSPVALSHPITTRTRNQPVKCFKCNGPHIARECLIKGIVCFKCQKPRYIARDF